MSLRSFPNPAIIGLSCMLFPLWPRRPQRLLRAPSWPSSPPSLFDGLLLRPPREGLGGPSCIGFGLPPRIADTDECWERACFWMAEVMEMHSEITRDTGSTATDTGRLRYCIRGLSIRGPVFEEPSDWVVSMPAGVRASRCMVFAALIKNNWTCPSVSRGYWYAGSDAYLARRRTWEESKVEPTF